MAEQEPILLADDEPQMLAMLSEILREQGYAVRSVADGLEALKAIQQEKFHLALLDLGLPGLSGLELLSRIKAEYPQTEVIVFTGHAGLDSAVQALRLGAYDYLVKSEIRLENLQAVVARALERRRLALSNRELITDLRRVQQELSQQHSQGLSRVRRLGEALAVPLTWEQLFHGLLNLIWESLDLQVLGLEFQAARKELTLEAFRRQPGLSEEAVAGFKTWLKRRFHLAAAKEPETTVSRQAETPFPEILQAQVRTGGSLALVAGARQTPFTPEESELFNVVLLQGEAALKNLELFEEVKSLAIRDGLTGLYNYRHFWELLAHEVEQSRRYETPLSLLFLDLDNFKVINDTLGHSQGDAVLKTLADYLQGALRQADVICRYGGEEFVVLLPKAPLDQAMRLAERLRRKISELVIPLPERDLRFTVSIGVARLTPDMDGEALVNAADAAMYQAKQAGRNQVCGPEGCLLS
ncbi:MAG: diguanylate cyclase [Deltaproteobacteria bacterium]|nr:diguanylate cyclase [Deltaproteobacteria bacterium]